MRVDHDHIAIPVNTWCTETLLKTDGLERKVSFLNTSDSNSEVNETLKTGTHQSLLKRDGLEGKVSFLNTSDSNSEVNETLKTGTHQSLLNLSSFRESGVKSGLRTQGSSPFCSSSQETEQSTTLVYVKPVGHAHVSETGSRTLLHSTSNEYTSEPPFQKDGFHQSPINPSRHPPVLWSGKIFNMESKLVCMYLSPSKKTKITTPYDRLKAMIEGWIKERRIDWKEEMRDEIPRNWERHGDLVLLPTSSFRDQAWDNVRDFWSLVAKSFNCTRIAKRGRIQSDDFRSPHTEMVLGSDPLVEHRDNGIIYSFDVRYSMFSSGNITEKLRVAQMDCSNETVVDLYAGIGYFTLPYLVHAKAKLLFACEWNPHAVNALQKNLELNSVNERCIVLEGDNRKVCPVGVANRVNLGLIPSSEKGWPVACAALNPMTGGVLHIHGNVDSYPHQEWNNPSSRKDDSYQSKGCFLDDSEVTSDHCQLVAPKRTHDTVLPEDNACQEWEIGNTSQSEIVENGNTFQNESGTKLSESGYTSQSLSGNKVSESGNTSQSLSGNKVSESGSTSRSLSGNKVSENGNTSQNESGSINLETGNISHSKSNGLHPTCLFNQKVSSSCSHYKQAKWIEWGSDVARQIKGHLCDLHGSHWNVEMLHIEQVKSYAPHIDHLVLDIECRPVL
ncbi:tRNA wybutosine-synthesizing protein 2 homolog isoform X2 [Lytechinus variegatus]|nr:tRNA wybutosine-synthesizing protein 2 homolog isoform X2 [Lytechinus variegatus]